jgi:hypothetical protein
MERAQILEAMSELKLYGMRGAYDEIVAVVPKARFQRDRKAAARTAEGRRRPSRSRDQRE